MRSETSTPGGVATLRILGVPISLLRLDELIERILAAIASGRREIVTYANVHTLNMAVEDPDFRRFLDRADVVFCDGYGVKWGARLLGGRIPERFTPPDFLPRLAARCAERGHSIYLVGARPGIAERAAERLARQAPGLRTGAHHGYFDPAPGGVENRAVVAAIDEFRPDLLLVGLGMPRQENWLEANWPGLAATVAFPVGAAFDYLAGEVARAPRWMTDRGLEWLGRLLVEPRRMWRRYLLGNPRFLWRVVLQRLGRLELEK